VLRNMAKIEIESKHLAHAQKLKTEELRQVASSLSVLVEQLVERAFREYAKGHTKHLDSVRTAKDIEDTEWSRFRSKLRKYLR